MVVRHVCCALRRGQRECGDATHLTNPGAAQGPQEPAARYLVVENVGQYRGRGPLPAHAGEPAHLADRRCCLADRAGSGRRRRAGRAGRSRLAAPDAARPAPSAGARSGTALRFTFPGANPAATLEPFGRVPTHVSYLIGNDPSRWQRDVPVWSGVRYRDLYPGVDLVIGGDAAGAVPWRLEARPGADLQAVTLRVEGADTVAAEAGQLRLEMKGRAVGVALPAWSLAGQANPVGSAVVRQAGDGAFIVAPESGLQPGQAPDAGTAGVADAADLIYSTFLGGTAHGRGIWDCRRHCGQRVRHGRNRNPLISRKLPAVTIPPTTARDPRTRLWPSSTPQGRPCSMPPTWAGQTWTWVGHRGQRRPGVRGRRDRVNGFSRHDGSRGKE